MQKCALPKWRVKKRAVLGSGCSILVVFICIFGGAPTEIAGQGRLVLEPGSRVRVTAPGCGLREQVTRYRALRAGTLVLDTTECPLASVTRLDVSRGRTSHTALGAGIGLAAGGVGTIIYCKAVDEYGCQLFDDDLTPIMALIFGAGGALVGGIAGHHMETDRWEEVPLKRLRVTIGPQLDGGFALVLSIRF